MTLRTGHGRGAGVPRVEVSPVDELPAGVAAPKPELEALPRPPYPAGSAAAREAGRRGGEQRADQTRLAHRLRLGESFADPRFDPYARAAVAFRRAQVATIAATVGGGTCGPAPSSMVASAALQLAASRYAFEVLGDMALGSRLANDSRQNLLAAHELAAREAAARGDDDTADLRRRQAEFQRQLAARQASAAAEHAGASPRMRSGSGADAGTPPNEDASTGQPGPSNEVPR